MLPFLARKAPPGPGPSKDTRTVLRGGTSDTPLPSDLGRGWGVGVAQGQVLGEGDREDRADGERGPEAGVHRLRARAESGG